MNTGVSAKAGTPVRGDTTAPAYSRDRGAERGNASPVIAAGAPQAGGAGRMNGIDDEARPKGAVAGTLGAAVRRTAGRVMAKMLSPTRPAPKAGH